MDFIELTVKNHVILHGFDNQNQEILEEVEVDSAAKKLIAIHRILSVSEKYVLVAYAYDRIIYWEYEESYNKVKKHLNIL